MTMQRNAEYFGHLAELCMITDLSPLSNGAFCNLTAVQVWLCNGHSDLLVELSDNRRLGLKLENSVCYLGEQATRQHVAEARGKPMAATSRQFSIGSSALSPENGRHHISHGFV